MTSRVDGVDKDLSTLYFLLLEALNRDNLLIFSNKTSLIRNLLIAVKISCYWGRIVPDYAI